MFSDREVRELYRLVAGGKPLYLAAARIGMSEKTARRYIRAGRVPSQMKRKRHWRTRADAFDEEWGEIARLLEAAPGLEAKTIFEDLCGRDPGKFQEGQLRTLQRRVRDWRALQGPSQEVFFPQVHRPGEQGQTDFTCMNELGITIAGVPFEHLAYHFVLPYSNWEYVELAFSESFEALSRGLQNALWTLEGSPEKHRTDHTTAATHDLKKEKGRAFNERYLALVRHYGLTPTTNNPGEAHENGDVEKAHDVFKHAAGQRLLLRGSRGFASREEYEAFLWEVVAARNAGRRVRFEEERKHLRPLPARRLEDFRELEVSVSPSSTVRVLHNVYSVHSRLIGYRVRARVDAEFVEIYYGSALVERIERLRGLHRHRINYRHVVGWLVRKPGAFERYRYREDLFPRVVFRRAYDALVEALPQRASVEYLRVLELAATTIEAEVASVLERLLGQGVVPTAERVSQHVVTRPPACPTVEVREPSLAKYDELLEAVG